MEAKLLDFVFRISYIVYRKFKQLAKCDLRTPNPEAGQVALLSTIMISILLLIITVSMTVLMVGELRQSTDSDLSIRAYYAAEAGVEDALLYLKAHPGFTTNGNLAGELQRCDSDGTLKQGVLDATNGTAFTCTLIYNIQNSVSDDLMRDEAFQLNLAGINNAHSVEIVWEEDGKDTSGVPLLLFPGVPSSWLSGSAYGAGRPAAMETILVDWLASAPGGVPPLATVPLNYLLAPTNSSATYGPVTDYGCSTPNGPDAAGNTYYCRAVVNLDALAGGNHSGHNTIVRIKPRYAATHFEMHAWTGNNGTGNLVDFSSPNATVDVTAKAGDVYRRVVATKRITPFSLYDFVLFSSTNICKNLEIYPSNATAPNTPYGIISDNSC